MYRSSIDDCRVINASHLFNKNHIINSNNNSNNSNIIRVYMCENGAFTIVKISNNRLYRVVDDICIMINNIPNNWRLYNTFKDMTKGNIKALYQLLISNSNNNINSNKQR